MRYKSARFLVPIAFVLCAAFAAYAAPAGLQRDPIGGKPSDTGPLAEITHRLQALRQEFHGQLDPLQAQVKALHDKYDPQIKDLEDQRHDLAEKGKSQPVQDLDAQEEKDLAALADQERSDLEKVRQGYTDKRKAMQADYAARRAALEPPKH